MGQEDDEQERSVRQDVVRISTAFLIVTVFVLKQIYAPAPQALAALKEAHQTACSCKTAPCADAAAQSLLQVIRRHRSARGTEEDAAEGMRLVDGSLECLSVAGVSPLPLADVLDELDQVPAGALDARATAR